MKLWTLVSAIIILSALTGPTQQAAPDKSWRFGPYDKNIPKQPPRITNIFTTPPPPAVRGAMLLPLATTNEDGFPPTLRLTPPRTLDTTNRLPTLKLRLNKDEQRMISRMVRA